MEAPSYSSSSTKPSVHQRGTRQLSRSDPFLFRTLLSDYQPRRSFRSKIVESGAGFNLYSIAEAQHVCYGFTAECWEQFTDGEGLQSTFVSIILVNLCGYSCRKPP